MTMALRTTPAARAWPAPAARACVVLAARACAVLAALALAGLGSTATGCSPDLGDPVLRYADWDATLPEDDGGGSNSNTSLAQWLPDCGPGYYPCPPYGTRRNEVLASFDMVAANDSALDLADAASVFGLVDLHLSGAKLLFVFMTAGW